MSVRAYYEHGGEEVAKRRELNLRAVVVIDGEERDLFAMEEEREK